MQPRNLDDKKKKLAEILASMGRVAVAFSGGVDSAFLLKSAYDVLGENAIAFLGSGPIFPEHETLFAREFAKGIGVLLVEIDVAVHEAETFAANPPNRCYGCKRAIFEQVIKKAELHGISVVIEGGHLDDETDYRPGKIALQELGVTSPLADAGFTKAEIRAASKELGLPSFDRPSLACLASRFPYGTRITIRRLQQVAQVEQALRDLGFAQVRARYHQDVARIEAPPDALEKMMDAQVRKQVIAACKMAGFAYAALDLEGYRTGSLNEVLKNKE